MSKQTGPAGKRDASHEPQARGSAPLRSVLVPLDLTAISDRIVSRVSQLPLADDVRITLLHVVPAGLAVGEQRGAERDGDKALAVEARHLRKLLPKTARVHEVVTRGTPATEIAAFASKVHAELIVVGRSGARPLRDAFLGSTAERVIRQARLPVLAVRSAARAPYHRPLVALDLDPIIAEVVRVMLRVLPPPRPSLAVVHAFDTPYRGLIYPSLHEAEAEELKNELRAKATHALATRLTAALAKSEPRPERRPLWKTHVRYGSPRAVVQKAMQTTDADLLVLGTRGYSGAAYAFLGTVAGDLLRAAKCDVLLIPPARSGDRA